MRQKPFSDGNGGIVRRPIIDEGPQLSDDERLTLAEQQSGGHASDTSPDSSHAKAVYSLAELAQLAGVEFLARAEYLVVSQIQSDATPDSDSPFAISLQDITVQTELLSTHSIAWYEARQTDSTDRQLLFRPPEVTEQELADALNVSLAVSPVVIDSGGAFVRSEPVTTVSPSQLSLGSPTPACVDSRPGSHPENYQPLTRIDTSE